MCKNSESSNNITYFKKPYQKYNNNSKQYRKYNENDLFNKIISTNSPPKKVQETKTNFPSESKVFLKEENYYKSYKPYNKFSNKNRKFSKDSANDSTSNEDNNEIISPNNKEINNNNINNQNSKNQIKPKVLFKSKADDFKIKYKTELCKYFEINGFCKFGDSCAYAHGKENLRSKVTNSTAYRSKKCLQFYQNGFCPYGNRCQFAHELKSNILNNPYDKNITYLKTIQTLSKLENINNIKALVEKPRLEIFTNFAENDCKSELFNDIKFLVEEDSDLYKKTQFE